MENDIKMKAFPISKTSLEKAREATLHPEIYGQISEILEAATKDVVLRVAIVPDLHEHIALLIAGTKQLPVPLREVSPVIEELKNSGVMLEVIRDFNFQLAQAKKTFEILVA